MKLKNYFLSASLLFLGASGFSQTILSEDFNGTTPLTNWTLLNVDARTPAAAVNYVTDAWVIREDFDTVGVGDNVAVSTSWYTPAGAADDYLVSPSVILGANSILQYDAKAQDAAFPDGYELRISTSTPTVAGLLANPALLTVSAESASWNRRSVDLSAYANDTVYLAWRNNSNDMFLLLVDNVKIFNPSPEDVVLKSLNLNSLYANASTVTISGTIENAGSNALTSVDISWTADGGTTVNTDAVTLNLASFTSQAFTHSVTWTATNAGMNTDIEVWVSNPNNTTDANLNNDTLVQTVFVNNGTSGSKKVLLEEFTTAPCQFCPDGAVVVENILATVPEAIGVGVHAGFGTDAMTIPAHVAYAAAFAPGAPTATVDRVLFDGETDVAISRAANGWLNAVNAQKAASTPVDVSLSGVFNSASSVDLTVDVNFVDYPLDAQNLRVSVFVIEDSVTGVGSGYDQVNAYNTQAGHPYFGTGNPIVGYVHRHVLRDVPSGTWGDATYFATSPTLNSTYTKTYTLTLASNWKAKDLSFIAFVNYYNPNGGLDEYSILNAEEIKLSTIVGAEENVLAENSLEVFPNPADDQATVTFELESNEEVSVTMLDITGKVISREAYGLMSQGSQRIELNTADLSEGLYFINLRIGENQIVRKIAVK
mgnify:CR=1 FL=1|tara:strand:- start:2446 stop:4407 length:1962 start_codon:yes stop_codon:yes gene_type:complete